jgi:hypothetical protein
VINRAREISDQRRSLHRPKLQPNKTTNTIATLANSAKSQGILWPNGQELSHAAGDSRQPEIRSENCKA